MFDSSDFRVIFRKLRKIFHLKTSYKSSLVHNYMVYSGPLYRKIHNLEIEFWNLIFQKKKEKKANESRFYCLYVKKKTSCDPPFNI